jgi:hypothetical protein
MNFEMSFLTILREDWEKHIHRLQAKFPSIFRNRRHCNFIVAPLHLKPAISQITWLVPGIPCTEDLASLCDSFFGWGPDILKYMAKHVWEGQFVRQLIQVF